MNLINAFWKKTTSITYATPTVNANLGTLDTSPSKNLAFAIIVSYANVFTLVLDVNDDPGSLNAICPSGPMPFFKKNIWYP